jgi:hypothetical protein
MWGIHMSNILDFNSKGYTKATGYREQNTSPSSDAGSAPKSQDNTATSKTNLKIGRRKLSEPRLNLLFGRYTLGFARVVFDCSVVEIAIRYNVSPHTWRKYEEGVLRFPADKIEQLQNDVRGALKCVHEANF